MEEYRGELLAPAGTMDCLKAAIAAGADAVYLGGQRFGARAFAGNFSREELLEGLSLAHLWKSENLFNCQYADKAGRAFRTLRLDRTVL